MRFRIEEPNFQDQWGVLDNQGVSDFDKALILLCDYAEMVLTSGEVVTEQIPRLTITHNDRVHADEVSNALTDLFTYYDEDTFLQTRGLFCIVPALIAQVKNKLGEQSLDANETLNEILTVICSNTGLDYQQMSCDPVEHLVNTWILTNWTTNFLPSRQEISFNLAENIEKITAEYQDEIDNKLIPYLFQKVPLPHKTLIVICVLNPNSKFGYFLEHKTTEGLIDHIFFDHLANAIVRLDEKRQLALLNHQDVVQAVKQNPYQFIKVMAKKNLDNTQAQSCIDILAQLNLFANDHDPDDIMNSKNFADLKINKALTPLEYNISLAQPLVLSVIKTKADAEYVCTQIGNFCPQLSLFIATAFEVDCNKLLRVVVDSGLAEDVKLLFQTYPKGTFDLTSQDSETGQTALHHAAKSGSTSVTTNLISLNRNCLFVRDHEKKLPADYQFVSPFRPLQRETGWDQIKTWLFGFGFYDQKPACLRLPKEILLLIALRTIQAHYGKNFSIVIFTMGSRPDPWCKEYLDREEGSISNENEQVLSRI